MENNIENIDYNNIQKMVFIYKALHDGWSVKKIDNDKYELTKEKDQLKKEVILEECIKKLCEIK
jgi:hypothetical protein